MNRNSFKNMYLYSDDFFCSFVLSLIVTYILFIQIKNVHIYKYIFIDVNNILYMYQYVLKCITLM